MHTLYEELFPNDLTNQVTRDGHVPVASGGFADIYQGVLQDNGQSIKVAIKAIKTYLGEDNKFSKKQKRLRREIKVWLNLRHDNVVPFLGVTMGFGRFPAMVCPWVENGTLTLYLENRYDSLSVIGVLDLLNNVASGLQYLHSCSVVHGDLSGSNVLIHESGRACIADFGLSMLLTELGSTFDTSVHARGTLRWAAPELLDLEPVDDMHQESPRVTPVTLSDVYSFGSVMLQILSGKVPYHYYVRDVQVMLAVSRRITPTRPSSSLVTERRWMFIQRCWSVDTRLRPSGEEIVEFIEQELTDCQLREIMMPVAPQPRTTVPTVAPPHSPSDDPMSDVAQPTSSLAALDRPVAPSALSPTSSEPRYEMSPGRVTGKDAQRDSEVLPESEDFAIRVAAPRESHEIASPSAPLPISAPSLPSLNNEILDQVVAPTGLKFRQMIERLPMLEREIATLDAQIADLAGLQEARTTKTRIKEQIKALLHFERVLLAKESLNAQVGGTVSYEMPQSFMQRNAEGSTS